MIVARVQDQAFDPGAELEAIGRHGAVASFIGHVRGDDGVAELFLEHYPAMTAAALHALGQDAIVRWGLAAVALVHRVGALAPGDRIVLVAAASAHRAAALAACSYLIDRLKTDVPLWKRETMADGARRWVEPRAGDAQRSGGWR